MKKRRFRQSLTSVVLVSIIVLIVIVQAGTSAIGYYQFQNTLIDQYRSNTNMLVNAAVNTINVERLDAYLANGGQDEDYWLTKNRLTNLAESSGSYVIYVAKLDEVTNNRIYIFNAVRADSGMEPYEIGYQDAASSGFIESYNALQNGATDTKNYTYTKSNNSSLGPYTTTVAALRNESGELVAICGIVMPMTALVEASQSYLHQLIVWLILIFSVACASWFITIRRRVVRPLQQIADEAVRFSKEHTIAEVPIADIVRSHSEIGEVAETIDEMEVTIVHNVEKLLELSKEKNRIETELNVATQIQANVLPQISESFPGRTEFDIFAYMKPAKEVGGDFYDFFFIDENHFAMVIADVAGKGVPAALYMMVSKVLIKAACANGNADPGEVLTNVNKKLCENEAVEMFVTVWLGILDLTTGTLMASNAGHEYPIVGPKDQPMAILKDKHGFVLGGMSGVKEHTYSLPLQPGDTLFVYTDGVAEAIDAQQNQFGLERLVSVLNQENTSDPEEKVRAVIRAIDDFTEGEEQFDDTTMLCLRYNG